MADHYQDERNNLQVKQCHCC